MSVLSSSPTAPSQGTAALRRMAAQLARWWWAEALRRLPSRLKPKDVGELVVQVADGRLLLWRYHAEGPDGAARTEPMAPVELADPQASTRLAAELKGARPLLRLTVERLLTRGFVLPTAAAAHLRQVVALDLDRRTPLSADQAWFAAEVVGRDEAGQTVEVALTVIPRTAAAAPLEALARLGLVPSALLVEGPGTPRLRMPLDIAPAASGRLAGWRTALAAAAVLLVLGGAFGAQVWRLERLKSEVRAAQPRAAAVLAQADAVAALRTEAFFAVERKRAAPSALVVIEAMSRLLPEETWLTELRFDGKTVEILGLTRDSSQLVPMVEGSPHFDGAQFRAALIRDNSGNDRFHLAATVVPHAVP